MDTPEGIECAENNVGDESPLANNPSPPRGLLLHR